jgi:hypothetical protein
MKEGYLTTVRKALLIGAALLAVTGAVRVMAGEAEDQAELARKTLNPIAALISLPIQFNYDRGIGPTDDGKKFVVNIQPVIPISIGPEWNLISRTILPIIDQEDILPEGAADESGIGDITQSLFFRRKRPGQTAGSGAQALSCCFPRRATRFWAVKSGASAPRRWS